MLGKDERPLDSSLTVLLLLLTGSYRNILFHSHCILSGPPPCSYILLNKKMSFLRARRLFSTVSSGSTLPSLTRGLFRGHLATESVYPYPPQEVMNAEEGETLKMLVEPSRHFFSKVNDAAANDESASIPEKTYAGLRELGAYGMQVSVQGRGFGTTIYI